MYKYLAFKGATNGNSNCDVKYYALKGAQTATSIWKYLAFKGPPPAIV